MTIGSLGSMGMGLVWGWLLILVTGYDSTRPPLRNVILLTLTTVLFVQQMYMFAGDRAPILFLGATTLSLIIHLKWRRSLKAI